MQTASKGIFAFPNIDHNLFDYICPGFEFSAPMLIPYMNILSLYFHTFAEYMFSPYKFSSEIKCDV